MKAIVKFFNERAGYGFLTLEDKREVFVHHSSIVMGGFKTLSHKQVVEFDLYESEKGLEAKNVKVC